MSNYQKDCLGYGHSSSVPSSSCVTIDHLPVEVLQEIFGLALAIDNSNCTFPHASPHKDRAPMVLTFVCSQWRNICIDMAELWSAITNYDLRDKKHGDQLFSLWLERSRDAPLTLQFYPPSNPNDENEAKTLDKVFVLSTHELSRWKFITFDGRRSDGWDNYLYTWFISIPETGAPLLEGLSLHLEAPDDAGHVRSWCSDVICTRFPNLRQLDLGISYYQDEGSRLDLIGLPLQNLTHFKEEIPFWINLPTVSAFQQVVDLTLWFESVTETMKDFLEMNKPSSATLPHLRSLALTTEPPFTSVLRFFDCPLLRRLYINDLHFGGDVDFDGYSTFHRRSPDLEQLQVCFTDRMYQRNYIVNFLLFLNDHCRSIPEVEIRAEPLHTDRGDPRRRFEAAFSEVREFYCAVNCAIPHLGWTQRKDGMIGIPLPKIRPLAFWDRGQIE